MNKLNPSLKINPSILFMLVIAIAFPLIYTNLFYANFISWDDTEYVLENQDVHFFNIKHFFSKSYRSEEHTSELQSL